MKDQLTNYIIESLNALDMPSDNVMVNLPKNSGHGDFSSNVAMILSGKLKQNPIEIAEKISKQLQSSYSEFFDEINIAPPGFINFKLSQKLIADTIIDIIQKNDDYGKSTIGVDKRVLVEFVSANPTGPLTVGHGRGAMLGDTVSNIMEWNGYTVEREYYFNNAGRQMRKLGESVYSRYCELIGKKADFPEGGYEGQYIYDIAQTLVDQHDKSLFDTADVEIFKNTAEQFIFEDIKNTLKKLGLKFDSFFNEHALYENNAIFDFIDQLKAKNLVYEKDGATWFAATNIGHEADRVLVKSTGEPTYRLPDMAYHKEKFDRGYDLMIDVFGADHMDAYPDVLAAISQLGYDKSKVNVLIHQFVTILKDGAPIKMSTRKANFVTLDELIEEVGSDVVRYFFIMRGMNTHLNFDLDLAKDESDENPVFYLQYAHARVSNILKRASDFNIEQNMKADLSLLKTDTEINLINKMNSFPDIIKRAHETKEPQNIATYLHDLAMCFHKFYAKHKVITDNVKRTASRLLLVKAMQIVLKNGLTVLGISAPERM